jgi:hypothetical protein
MDTSNTTDLLSRQLEKSPGDSKKWQMTKVGLIGIAAFTVLGSALLFLKPEVAQHAVTLISLATGAWTVTTGAYVGAQAAVDAKTTGALQAMNENK